jgi:hypothetical protein
VEPTRGLGTSLLVSNAVLAAGADTAGFVPLGEHLLCGRTAPLRLWAAAPEARAAAE